MLSQTFEDIIGLCTRASNSYYWLSNAEVGDLAREFDDVRKTAELIIEAMQAAKRHGAIVSFDLNYREKLWNASGGGHTRALEVMSRIVKHVDVLVGNEEDLQKGLGIPGPEVAAKSGLDSAAFLAMIDNVVSRHPQIKVLATTLREVHSTNRHRWSAVAWMVWPW